MPAAYSYIRFSTPEQGKGNSLIRQTESAARYAKEHELILDDSITYLDAGISGFTGANAETGMLGAFLQAVQNGIIERGSYLLVENLDRISRQTARKAARKLEEICDEGISVVTLNDGKVYTADSLNEDPFSFVLAILIFMRAHEESATKSKRGLDNWKRKRDAAKKAGKPMSKRIPAWLQLTPDRSKIIPIDERVAVVQEIYQKHMEGVGVPTLTAMLNERGVECWGVGGQKARQWHKSYISKILCNSAVIGEYTPYTLVERKKSLREQIPLPVISKYYPAIIDEETFYRVQDIHKDHKLRGKKISQEVQNIFARLAVCPYCKSTMTRINKGTNRNWQYLLCTTAKVKKGCEYKLLPYSKVEEAFISGFFASIPSDNTRRSRIAKEIEAAKVQIAKLDYDINNYMEAVRSGTRTNDDELENFEFTDEAGGTQRFIRRLFEEVAVLEDGKKALEDRIIQLRVSSVFTDTKQVAGKIDKLSKALEGGSKAAINSCLLDLVDKVVIDYDSECLTVHFKHTAKIGKIPFFGYKTITGNIA